MRSVAAAAALVLLAGCAAPADETPASAVADVPAAATAAGDDPAAEVAACIAPSVPSDPVGVRVDLADGRAPAAAGPGAGARAVEVLDLATAAADAEGLAAALAATLDPCAEQDPTTAPGGSTVPVLLARWGVDEVLVVEADDAAARSALVAASGPGAVPLVLPTLVAPPAGADGSEVAPPTADPALDVLALLPAGTGVTATGSDAARADAVAARLLAAGRGADDLRVLGPGDPPAALAGPPRPPGPPDAGGTLWLVDPSDPTRALVASAAAMARGESALVVDPADAAEVLRHADVLRSLAPARLLLVGDGIDPAAVAWHLDVSLHTDPLPWGGWLPLDGTRIVAVYGSPDAPTLGVLGQQDLDATFVRVRELGEPYAVDGLRVVPGLDMIATVATSVAGPDGDYSRRVPIARLRPWVDRAREEGAAVFIDLQPGRTDFLTQAKEYEELLLEPHVFLALDPEWRLRPDQVHLRQIGSVEAAEVQAVADWLAELVRRERLPQKVLMLHQFLLTMLPDRDTVVVPPELIGVVHVDGQGPVATKQRTYRIMSEAADAQWRWGWKQFLRIDTPRVMDPADVIARDPVPVVITYQ